MANIISYNDIIEIMESIAQRHYQLNSFFLGKDWELANNDDIVYPLLQVYPEFAKMPINDYKQFKTLEIVLNCKVIDLTTPGEENEKDVHSDTLRIAQDIVNELNAHPFYVRSNVSLMEDIEFESIEEFDDDVTAGWSFSLRLKIINANTFCGMPIAELPGVSANGPSSSGTYVYTDWRGPTGPQGPVGPTGADGYQGVDGATGATGPQGATGSQGIQGERGATGSSGTFSQTLSQVLLTGATAGTNITMTSTKVIKSSNGGGELGLDGGSYGLANTVYLTNDNNGFGKSYLSFDYNLYGYNNYINLVANDTSIGTQTASVIVGVYSANVSDYKSSAEFNSTNLLVKYKATQINFTDGLITMTPTKSLGGVGTVSIASPTNHNNYNIIGVNGLSASNLTLSGISANTLTYTNASKLIQSVSIGSGLTFSSGVLSTIVGVGATNFINKKNSDTPHTGTTSPTVIHSFEITPGTCEANDVLKFYIRHLSTNNANSKTVKIWANSSNTTVGATTVATYAYTTNSGGVFPFKRSMIFKNSLTSQKIINTTTSHANDEVSYPNNGDATLSLNFNNSVFIFIEVTLANAADTFTMNLFNCKIER